MKVKKENCVILLPTKFHDNHFTGGDTMKTIIFIAGIIILIYGICLGGGKKSNSKDNTRRYDKKEQDPLMHAARLADPNYAPKGSGFYKDRNGVKHSEKK